MSKAPVAPGLVTQMLKVPEKNATSLAVIDTICDSARLKVYPNLEWWFTSKAGDRGNVERRLTLAPDGRENDMRVLLMFDWLVWENPHIVALEVCKIFHRTALKKYTQWWEENSTPFDLEEFFEWVNKRWQENATRFSCNIVVSPYAREGEQVITRELGKNPWEVTLHPRHYRDIQLECSGRVNAKVAEGYFPWTIAESYLTLERM